MEVGGARDNNNLSLRPPSLYSEGSNSPYRSRYDIKKQAQQCFCLRISTSHETNGQAYLRKESPHWLREFVYQNHCVSFVVYLPNKIFIDM